MGEAWPCLWYRRPACRAWVSLVGASCQGVAGCQHSRLVVRRSGRQRSWTTRRTWVINQATRVQDAPMSSGSKLCGEQSQTCSSGLKKRSTLAQMSLKGGPRNHVIEPRVANETDKLAGTCQSEPSARLRFFRFTRVNRSPACLLDLTTSLVGS